MRTSFFPELLFRNPATEKTARRVSACVASKPRWSDASEDETWERHVYHPYVPTSGTKLWKTKNFAFFQVLRQTLAEREGLSARCLKPRDFNGFEPADFAMCTSHVY